MTRLNGIRRCWSVLATAMIGCCRSLLRDCIYLVYPPFCLACEGELRDWEQIVCDRCWSTFEIIDGPVCGTCGTPLKDVDQTCRHCSVESFTFHAARASYLYSKNLRRAVHAFKFRRKVSLAKRLGRALAFTFIADERIRSADHIIPVPLHISRLRERGYNQSELLTAEMAEELSVPCLKQVLVRSQNTKSMTALTPERRRRNVEGAFKVVPGENVQGKHVVLVDDVLTTGATADACARVLLRAGCAQVHVLTVARAF